MKFFTYTLGCKVNTYETEGIISNLKMAGYELTADAKKADIIIVNSCTVTKTSDDKTKKMLRHYRKTNPSSIIAVMGCYSQLNSEEAKSLADIVLGNANKLQLLPLLVEYRQQKQQLTQILDLSVYQNYEEMYLNELSLHSRGFIKIQDGCENRCSYCAIPNSRGLIRSRNADSIIDEINRLVTLGVKEIILSGINTGAYGRDLKDINLAKLLVRIFEETKIYRVRISSLELKEITDELLNVLKKYETRVANHFHIPMQSGSDKTLIRMNRKYQMNDYLEMIAKIRSLFPNVAITTDCLAGFAGESEEEFLETIDNIKRIKFASMHIFPYSKRPNTLAYSFDNHLDAKVINKRTNILLNLAKDLKQEYLDNQKNLIHTVIVEQKKGNYYTGHTSNYLEVLIDSDIDLTNKVVNVKITETDNLMVKGELLCVSMN